MEPLFLNTMPQGRSGLLKRPHNSPLMKLPTRPAASPVGTQGATRSITCSQGFCRVRANQTCESNTPIRPP